MEFATARERTGLSAKVDDVRVSAYRVPTDKPESDGTLEWNATTMVLVEITAGGTAGLGYTYADRAVAVLVEDLLGPLLKGSNAFATGESWHGMIHATRNLGRPGIVSMAVAACDVALHDLKAKLLEVPVAVLLGSHRSKVQIYGSGGFTSYSERQLRKQLAGWAADGLHAVKMKVGREPAADVDRVAVAHRAIGKHVELFVDANGAYARRQALDLASRFQDLGVTWFEEPVSSNDLAGLRMIRDQGPPGIEIAAGEYGYDTGYFRTMAESGAVDVLQADATRCAGFTGFLLADAVALANELPLSSHTAPALHLHCCCAAHRIRHMEWFHDHVRIESMLFDGAPIPRDGVIAPDLSRPGLGLEFKRADAESYRI